MLRKIDLKITAVSWSGTLSEPGIENVDHVPLGFFRSKGGVFIL